MGEVDTGRSASGLRVLVVEDNDALRFSVCSTLRESWDVVDEESHGEAAIARISDPGGAPYHVVVTDLRLPGEDGLSVLRSARERDPRTRVIVMTGYASVASAVDAMRIGAFDFLQKPFDLEDLALRVAQAGESAQVEREEAGESAADSSADRPQSIVAESRAMKEAVDLARRVADTRSTVLITGETGTGKEVIAGLIHTRSRRAEQSFVKVNCAALPETLLESELFGHERGAFTGADRLRIGRFEQANGGTLFLDEIADMALSTQAKLLRVLQDQEFYRLGGTRPQRTDARIVCATNRDLADAMTKGQFREDLFFRLDVIGIHLAPLRERPEDLDALARAFLERYARDHGRPTPRLEEAAQRRLRTYRWPGNVRELANVIERAVLTGEGPRLRAEDLVLPEPAAAGGGLPLALDLPPEGVSLREVEKQLVVAALERSGFVQKDAARLLHVSRRKLNYMIRRMGLTHPRWRRNRGAPPASRRAAVDPLRD